MADLILVTWAVLSGLVAHTPPSAHVLVGVASVPLLLYSLATLSTWAWVFAAMYAPFFFYPAQHKFPGWKGARVKLKQMKMRWVLWAAMDLKNSETSNHLCFF